MQLTVSGVRPVHLSVKVVAMQQGEWWTGPGECEEIMKVTETQDRVESLPRGGNL